MLGDQVQNIPGAQLTHVLSVNNTHTHTHTRIICICMYTNSHYMGTI
jgi:hypothetical protein